MLAANVVHGQPQAIIELCPPVVEWNSWSRQADIRLRKVFALGK